MQPFSTPTLTVNAARVLSLVKEKGVLRGQDLVRQIDLPSNALIEAVRQLTSNDLITLSGDGSTPDSLAKSYLTFRPSATSMAEFAIRSAR
jgi:hypothetical protein